MTMFINQSFAQNFLEIKNFPKDIKNYVKIEEVLKNSKNTTLQLVLFDKQKFDKLLLDNNDLINDVEDLNMKIINYFKLKESEKTIKDQKIKKSKNQKKQIEENSKGYLLITKYFFLGKDKPYELDKNEDNMDLDSQIYKESKCNEGVCIAHIIMGINYFDTKLNIKPLDIDEFSTHISNKEEIIIRGNYEKSQEGVLKVYYIYGINGLILPKEKSLIKNMIEKSQK